MSGKVSIVVLNYYGKNDTIECLDSLEQTNDSKLFKVILVNNSPLETFSQNDINKYSYPIDYISPDKNYGFAGGCNIGIKKAIADSECSYVMLLNNDTIVTDGSIKHFIENANNQCDTLFNPVLVFYNTKKVQCSGGGFSFFLGCSVNLNKNKNPEDIRSDVIPYYLNGCCIFAEKRVFEKIGLFDERFFMYCEDLDFSIRAKKHGYKLGVLKDVVIYHKHSKSVNSSNKQFYICRNTVLFIIKNYGLFLAVLFMPVHFITQFFIGIIIYKNKNMFSVVNTVISGFFAGLKK